MGKILNALINVYALQNLFVFIETTYFISLKPYCIKNAQYQNIITHTN